MVAILVDSVCIPATVKQSQSLNAQTTASAASAVGQELFRLLCHVP